ncbi:MAG: hypothetical protein ABW221_24865 [Vicinamibacteria bacterium]
MDPGLLLLCGGHLATFVAPYLIPGKGRIQPDDWETAAEAAGLQDVSTTNGKGGRRLEASHGRVSPRDRE